jgi:hypothetical protein
MARRAESGEIESSETVEPGACSAIAATALKAGHFAPDFTVPDRWGGSVTRRVCWQRDRSSRPSIGATGAGIPP